MMITISIVRFWIWNLKVVFLRHASKSRQVRTGGDNTWILSFILSQMEMAFRKKNSHSITVKTVHYGQSSNFENVDILGLTVV